MNIYGLTIIKNCNRYQYPILFNIEQHRKFFHVHFIGLPKEEQDTDGTRKSIIDFCEEKGYGWMTYLDWFNHEFYQRKQLDYSSAVVLFDLDWPNEGAWSAESQDKTLQQTMLDNIYLDGKVWICKIDADEFYSDEDIIELKETMETFLDSNVNAISHNYKQYMGSLRYTVYDPTKSVCHIFKPEKAKFAGNDAMQFAPTEGEALYLEKISIHHIGYCKDPNLTTTRIKEHLVLNASMYQDAVKNAEKWKDYKFEFPKHRVGAKLWPLGISDAPNETEYQKADIETLPSVLRKNIEKFDFYVPNI